jgi:hypothetical protein
LALGTGVHIPQSDVVITTFGTKSADFAAEGWSNIGYDASNNDILDAIAFWAVYGTYLLTKVSPTLIYFCRITTIIATICMFPCHILVQR